MLALVIVTDGGDDDPTVLLIPPPVAEPAPTSTQMLPFQRRIRMMSLNPQELIGTILSYPNLRSLQGKRQLPPAANPSHRAR